MAKKTIIAKIVDKRKKDIERSGFSMGVEIPEKRTRPIIPFMENKGVILEVKRASPSKGDIAPDLNAFETAKKYRENGADAISCLTEKNYFKGSLQDLIDVCNAVPDVAVLRKDFLIDEQEIEIAYRCGADAVLLIAGILTLEKMLSMLKKCEGLGIKALVEVRTKQDVEKTLVAKRQFSKTIVCGVNSRNLKDFTIDMLVPAMLKKKLGGDVIFESGITTPHVAEIIGSMGFSGILLGEFAAKNPEMAGEFVNSFKRSEENLCGQKYVELAEKIGEAGALAALSGASFVSPKAEASQENLTVVYNPQVSPLVKICGLTRKEDVLLADSLGAAFVGFIFAKGFGRNVCGQKFEEIRPVLKDVKAFKVAVITDGESEEAHKAAELVKQGVLDFIQIHGISCENCPEYLKQLPHYFAVTDKKKIDRKIAGKLASMGEIRFLQDCRTHEYVLNGHLWLAGGVTPENVSELVKNFSPELVDVSSGIEDNEIGVKNEKKMKDFFAAIS